MLGAHKKAALDGRLGRWAAWRLAGEASEPLAPGRRPQPDQSFADCM